MLKVKAQAPRRRHGRSLNPFRTPPPFFLMEFFSHPEPPLITGSLFGWELHTAWLVLYHGERGKSNFLIIRVAERPSDFYWCLHCEGTGGGAEFGALRGRPAVAGRRFNLRIVPQKYGRAGYHAVTKTASGRVISVGCDSKLSKAGSYMRRGFCGKQMDNSR